MGPPSLLTRRVFGALLSNRPYCFTGCVRPPRIHASSPQSQLCRPNVRQTRSIFGISLGSDTRSLAAASNTGQNLQMAMKHMVDLVRAQRSRSKTPPLQSVLEAWKFLFRSRLSKLRRFSRNEIYLATEVFKHLRENEQTVVTEDDRLVKKDILLALTALARGSLCEAWENRERFRSDISDLARLLYESLQENYEVQIDVLESDTDLPLDAVESYVQILVNSGNATAARELVLRLVAQDKISPMKKPWFWLNTINGFIREGNVEDALKLLDQLETREIRLGHNQWSSLFSYIAERDDIGVAKEVFARYQKANVQPPGAARHLVKFCIRNKAVELGNAVYEDLVAPQHINSRDVNSRDISSRDINSRHTFRLAFLWLWDRSGYTSDIDHILEDAASVANSSGDRFEPWMSDFNFLLSHAYSRGDSNAAQVLLDSASARGLKVNASTFIVQLEYYIRLNNLDRAAVAYHSYVSEEASAQRTDSSILNRYVTALCFSTNPQTDQIMRVVDNLLDQGADLDAETLAGLSHVFLHQDELEELTGLLRYRIDSLPESDRARISTVFQQFITDRAIQDQRAYNAYDLFRHAFPETPVHPNRMTIMQSFFTRNRPDLACLVFGHTRQRDAVPHRPDNLAYAKAFEGIAQTRDVDGLQMVYNMLKLDLLVDPDTRIRNAMMAAYTATHQPWSAILDGFWKIMDSRLGPTLSSFVLALRACETWVPYGALEARNVMAVLQRYRVPVTKEVYDAYVGALAGNSEFENTVELVEEMEADTGFAPDRVTVGTFYNAIPWQWRKDEVETWAKRVFPEVWKSLLEVGDEVDEEWEVRYFKIDRKVDLGDPLLFGEGKGWDGEIARSALERLEAPPR